ncbi:phage virion morphogenesis protein [Providencia huashanensis]|uniref:Phage virion morphogenesis protein n=1 Tax=Providencia huashanensis TaxID=3037798 RepID=A0ABT9AM95_9GAMM|nr:MULTISPECIES: phage virion morphogenesis protein [unclassified Providencia]MDO7829466.1 phage virion morphogenesis protein [Providencia sp. CRE-138-0026]MDO7855543.1 phage virion morphogenesis protein [Providencia sp. CRE-138-0111]
MRVESQIDVTPIQQAFKRLQQLGTDTTPITRGIAAVLASESEDAFASETDPNTGKKWSPLSPRYQEKLDDSGRNGLMLQRSQGGLAMSLTTTYDATRAAIGSNKVYAALHQWGGQPTMPAAPAAVPARPYMGLSPQGVADIVDIIRQKHEEASRQR